MKCTAADRKSGQLAAAVRGVAMFFLSFAILPAAAQQSQFDQLQQLQQQVGQRQTGGTQPEAPPPPNIVLQPAPAVPRNGLAPSRLEQIMSARAGTILNQFGYDQLGNASSVTVPQTGAVTDDYVIGPGDEIVVSLRGQENSEFRTIVDRNGRITLPRLTPITVTGRALGALREDLQASVRRAYVATDAFVTLGRIRQISVLVSGEVNNPGQRLLTGLSSAVDALLLSGGIKKTGSLRNIRIQRGGREFSLDLYNMLTARGAGSVMRLTDGDRILVPPLGPTVAVTGLVRQPGIYELPSRGASIGIAALLSLAGGTEVRGQYRVSLMHILPDGRSQMVDVSNRVGMVRDSEILFVQLGADQVTNQATLSGQSALAGTYAVTGSTRLSELLRAPGALGQSPYTPFGILVGRDSRSMMPTLSAFTPVAVIAGKEDRELRAGDFVRVLSTNEIELLNFVVDQYLFRLADQLRQLHNPLGEVTKANGTSVAEAIAAKANQGEQFVDTASVPTSIQREEVIALLSIQSPSSVAVQRQQDQYIASVRNVQRTTPPPAELVYPMNGAPPPGTAVGQPFPQLSNTGVQTFAPQQQQPQQQPYVQAQPYAPPQSYAAQQTYGQQPNGVQTFGPSMYAQGNGQLPVPRFNANGDALDPFSSIGNFQEQSAQQGRFDSNREVQTIGQLARQLGVDPLILMNFLVDSRIRLDGAVRGPGFYFVGPSATVQDLVQAAGGTSNWADESGVELISTMVDRQGGHAMTNHSVLPLRADSLGSYVVHPKDQFRFAAVFTNVTGGSVTLQGEARATGTFPITRGEHLSELLAMAGGLTPTAYPYGTIFLRQSAAQTERQGYIRAANEVQNQLVVAMTRVGNDKIDPNAFASMQGFVKDLRDQKALGRISIAADPSVLASNPALDPLLEAGDVIYIPQRPSTISVLGQVLQPGSFPFRRGKSVKDYIASAGGYSEIADSSEIFVVLPDGSARRWEKSWLNIGEGDALPPGSSIVVPRDVTPLDLRQTIIDVSQIFSQFAVAIASIAVLSKQ